MEPVPCTMSTEAGGLGALQASLRSRFMAISTRSRRSEYMVIILLHLVLLGRGVRGGTIGNPLIVVNIVIFIKIFDFSHQINFKSVLKRRANRLGWLPVDSDFFFGRNHFGIIFFWPFVPQLRSPDHPRHFPEKKTTFFPTFFELFSRLFLLSSSIFFYLLLSSSIFFYLLLSSSIFFYLLSSIFSLLSSIFYLLLSSSTTMPYQSKHLDAFLGPQRGRRRQETCQCQFLHHGPTPRHSFRRTSMLPMCKCLWCQLLEKVRR